MLGRNTNGHTLVQQSINYQSAKRTYDLVDVHPKNDKKMKRILKYLSNQKLVGDFHSHSDYPDTLSGHDKKDLLSMCNKWVSLLLVIWDTNKRTPWNYNRKEKYLSGSIGKRFFVKIHAYKNIEGKMQKVRIFCPYIRRLNSNNF